MSDIIAPLPFDLTNNTTADADQVMADLNQIRNDINSKVAAGGPGISINTYRGAVAYSQAGVFPQIAFNSPTVISFELTSVDTDSIHNNSTNNSRLTVPSAVSFVRLIGHATFGMTALDNISRQIDLDLYKNGVQVLPTGYDVFCTNSTTIAINHSLHVTSPVLAVLPGDYFELFVQQSINTDTSKCQLFDIVNIWPFFEMQILG